MEISEFEKDLEIDKDDLDREWLGQPALYFKYAEMLANATRRKNKVWEVLKVTRSRLLSEAKSKGHSNAALQEAYYRNHKDHQEARDDLIEAEYEVDMLQNAVWAINQKKTALENEVKLWLGSYYSSPQSDERESEVKKMNNDLQSKRQRKAANKRRN